MNLCNNVSLNLPMQQTRNRTLAIVLATLLKVLNGWRYVELMRVYLTDGSIGPIDKLDSMLRNTRYRCYCVELFLGSVDLVTHTGRRSDWLVHLAS